MIAAPYNQQRHAGGYLRGVYTERAEARTTMPKGIYKRLSLQERFDAKWVRDPATGCHNWTSTILHSGYGQIHASSERPCRRLAHRAAWELAHGPVPDGMFVLHRCDNKRCVCLDHLFLGTHADNMADRNAKGRQARGERLSRALKSSEKKRAATPLGEARYNAKLTRAAVVAIRSRYAAGCATQTALAAEFGVSLASIHNAVHRKCWRCVD